MKIERLEFSQYLENIGRQVCQQPIGEMQPLETRRKKTRTESISRKSPEFVAINSERREVTQHLNQYIQ